MGRKCTLDSPQYNYLYFTTLNDVVRYMLYIFRLREYV